MQVPQSWIGANQDASGGARSSGSTASRAESKRAAGQKRTPLPRSEGRKDRPRTKQASRWPAVSLECPALSGRCGISFFSDIGTRNTLRIGAGDLRERLTLKPNDHFFARANLLDSAIQDCKQGESGCENSISRPQNLLVRRVAQKYTGNLSVFPRNTSLQATSPWQPVSRNVKPHDAD